MKCEICGAESEAGAKFCSSCGAVLVLGGTPAAPTQPATAVDQIEGTGSTSPATVVDPSAGVGSVQPATVVEPSAGAGPAESAMEDTASVGDAVSNGQPTEGIAEPDAGVVVPVQPVTAPIAASVTASVAAPAAAPVAATESVAVTGDSNSDRIGPYEIVGELGRGAMARVWRAVDPNLGREVAIKEPLFDQGFSDEIREEMGRRFVKEAKAAARLNHPGIVTIYAADVYDGRPAIVMELVEGATLGEILERGPLEPEAALDALNQLLDAIGYAHGMGVVHRDIKPDNIFVSGDGRVKLADFGIAHVDDDKATRATMFGTVLGTPGYMSPEQARGGMVDARSDLFSIGVVGYEMLSGRNPFGAGDGADATTLLYRIVHEPAPELPASAAAGLPADLRPAIMAALAKDPAARPQTAAAFKAMLGGASASSVASSVPPAPSAGLASAATKTSGGGMPKWLPYVIAAAACVVALAVVLPGALSGGGGGGGGAVASTGTSATAASAASASSASASAGATTYLAVRDGKVAIYTNSSAEPYKVTKVEVSELPEEFVEEVDDHVGFASVEEAEERVKEYREAIKVAKEEAERKAAEEAKAREEAEAAARAEEEARMQAEAEARARAEAEERVRVTTQSKPASSSSTMYVVNCNEFITLRAEPDAGSGEKDRIPLGAAVTFIRSAGNGFSEVSYDGQTGFALASYLSSTNSVGYETTLLRVVNCNEWISLRAQPSTDASTIARIPLGESARYISSATNGFYQVSYNGQVGYALSEYLTEW